MVSRGMVSSGMERQALQYAGTQRTRGAGDAVGEVLDLRYTRRPLGGGLDNHVISGLEGAAHAFRGDTRELNVAAQWDKGRWGEGAVRRRTEKECQFEEAQRLHRGAKVRVLGLLARLTSGRGHGKWTTSAR